MCMQLLKDVLSDISAGSLMLNFISYVCIFFLDSCEIDDRLEIETRMGQNCISCGCFGQNRKLQSGLQVRISRPVIRC